MSSNQVSGTNRILLLLLLSTRTRRHLKKKKDFRHATQEK